MKRWIRAAMALLMTVTLAAVDRPETELPALRLLRE